jgi:hypothetical protein
MFQNLFVAAIDQEALAERRPQRIGSVTEPPVQMSPPPFGMLESP